MHDELIKRLRELASIPAHCENVADCDGCTMEDICLSFTNERIIETATQAVDAIEELQGQIDGWIELERKALLKSVPKWIPVEERLPETMHEYVLCCGEKGGQFVGWVAEGMIRNGKARAFQHGGKGRYFTHWMPLPEPPEEET